MNLRFFSPAFGLTTALVAGACQAPPPPTPADVAIKADCRETVERQYNAQNRADLTRRDERDYAFSSSYDVGISSRGLGAEFHRDQMVSDCLRAQGDPTGRPAAGVGPAFSPTQRGVGPSSLSP